MDLNMEADVFIKIFEDGLFAAIAAIGFSSISNTPRRAYFTCAVIAAAGHIIRFVLTDLGSFHIVSAATLGAVAVGVLSVSFSGKIKCPAEVCLFPALLPMIPGMYAYRTVEALLYCLFHTQEEMFGHYVYLLMSNCMTCMCIIVGMVFGATIPLFVLKKVAFSATR